ncbi:MAG: MgtC/SapB family protein [Daejeonella sp.]|uniref:MgtC/SapB family protein n=1 Tax=Daejeonella sp. JGW-45 TaxID=3034148 RepID=UPI0023EB27DA|nr:MgtC/SapB family protein [Daejeonella sp. JGW-45]
MEISQNDLITMLVSVLCGGVLGIEREYQNKSAGLRTIVLICLGATVFTMISLRIGGGDDRVAANIITGIGFIGAGVIFKENFNVKGLTTAAVIWIAAAIGMVIGVEEYNLAFVLSFIVILVLGGFAKLEFVIDFINHKRTYRITFTDDNLENIDRLVALAKEEKLQASVRHLSKSNNRLIVDFEVKGNKKHFPALTEQLVIKPEILGIEH